MQVGNQQITQEQMPSFVSPEKQPYHAYQSMQDTLNGVLNSTAMQMAPQQPQRPQQSMENRQNQWSNNNGN